MMSWNAMSSFDLELWQLNLKMSLLFLLNLRGMPHIRTLVVAPQQDPHYPLADFF